MQKEISQHKIRNPQPMGRIQLNKVKFISPDTGKIILNNISMTIEPGTFIGLIGASGAGKSTIFRLILGFEKINDGVLTIDGDNINDLDLQYMRKQFGIVLQTTN